MTNSEKLLDKLKLLSFVYDRESSHELRFDDINAAKLVCEEFNIRSDVRNNKLCVEKNNLIFSFFQDESQFIDEVSENHFTKPVVIFNYANSGHPLYYDQDSSDDSNYFIPNARAYLNSRKKFKEIHENSVDGFDFVDFYSDSAKSIVFSSISEKRRLKFEFTRRGAISLDTSIDFTAQFDSFYTALTANNKHYPMFLKNSLITNLINEEGNKYQAFFTKIGKIILDANLNFDVYLHELSLDKIKTDYKDYKQKFFTDQNAILSKISNHVIALPISIAAIAFSMFKLSGEKLPLSVVCLGLIGFTVYTVFIISIYISDIFELNDQSKKEFDILSEQDFFMNNVGELAYFKEIRSSLYVRLERLFKGLKIFTFSIWTLTGLLLIYGIKLLGVEMTETAYIISIIGLLLLISLVHSQVLFKKELSAD